MTTECKTNHGGGSTCVNSKLEGGGSADAGHIRADAGHIRTDAEHIRTDAEALTERSSLCVDDILSGVDPHSGIVRRPESQSSPDAELISIVIDMLLPAVPELESAGIRHIANDVSCACQILRWVQTHPQQKKPGLGLWR